MFLSLTVTKTRCLGEVCKKLGLYFGILTCCLHLSLLIMAEQLLYFFCVIFLIYLHCLWRFNNIIGIFNISEILMFYLLWTILHMLSALRMWNCDSVFQLLTHLAFLEFLAFLIPISPFGFSVLCWYFVILHFFFLLPVFPGVKEVRISHGHPSEKAKEQNLWRKEQTSRKKAIWSRPWSQSQSVWRSTKESSLKKIQRSEY